MNHSQRANQRYSNPEYRRFKKQVLERANHQCQAVENNQRCQDTKVQPHHITPIWMGGTHDPSNGVALCNKHHTEVDQEARRIKGRKRLASRHPGLERPGG